MLRRIALGCGAVVLLGSAYQASFARNPLRQAATRPIYGRDRGGGGLSGGEIAAIAAGGAGVVGLPILLGIGDDECEERYKILPQDHTRIRSIRLRPLQTAIDAGERRCYFLEVHSAHDNKWYSVTQRPEAEIRVAEPTEYLLRQDGTKNIFMVPLSASPAGNGRSERVVGTFTPPGQPTLTAESRALIRVPGGDNLRPVLPSEPREDPQQGR